MLDEKARQREIEEQINSRQIDSRQNDWQIVD
jgi:hypothetical protein